MHSTVLEQLDLFRFRRNGEEIERLLSANINNPDISQTFRLAVSDEFELFQTLKPVTDSQVSEKILREYFNHFVAEPKVYNDEAIDSLFLPIYCAEVLENPATKDLIKKLEDISYLATTGYLERLLNQPYRLRSYIELYLAKYLEDSKSEDKLVSLKKFESLLDVFVTYIVNNRFPVGGQYQGLQKSDKSVLFIILWKTLSLADSIYDGIDGIKRRLHFLLAYCKESFAPYFGELQKLLLLYRLNQTLLPLLNLKGIPNGPAICGDHLKSISEYITFFIGGPAFRELKVEKMPAFNDLHQLVLINFMLMHQINAKRATKSFQDSKLNRVRELDLEDIHSRLHPFSLVNLNEVRMKIKKLADDVKDHKYLMLFSGYLLEYYNIPIAKSVLEESLTQPFDDKQVTKTLLCFIHYLEGDHLKCYQLVYQLLEKEKLQEKNTFIITFLATLLCAKFLNKPEEGLVFGRLNLDYLSKKPVAFPVKPDVLHACIGYCYESMASQNPIFVERADLYLRAIEAFELSYDSNAFNKDVLYQLGLLYAKIRKYDLAYRYARESIKNAPGHLNSYLLLILISTATGDHKKAGLVIQEILPRHKHPLLYIFQIFLEIENLNSREAKNFISNVDDDLKDIIKPNRKNQEMNETQEMRELIQETYDCVRSAANCLLNTPTHNFEPPSVVSLASKYEPHEMVDYQNLLILSVEAFIRLKDYSSAEIFLDLSKMKNSQECEYLYYKGLIYEYKKNYTHAEEYYKAILMKSSTFYQAHLHLGILHLTVEERKDILKAKLELEEALRYEETPEILYYLGMIYEEEGNKKQSSQYMMKSLESSYHQPILPFNVLPNEIMLG